MENSGSVLRVAFGSFAGRRSPRSSSLEEDVVALFDQLRTPVIRYLMSNGASASDAEEMLQEVFLLLFRKLAQESVEDKGIHQNPAGWVFRTAHHFVLKYRDRQRRDARLLGGSPVAIEEISDVAERVDVAMEAGQRREHLLAVVRALPEQDRQCLHLRAEGLRYREIAEVMGMSLGSVANSLQTSIAKISRASERLR